MRDSPRGDVLGAYRAGLCVRPFFEGRLNRYEHELAELGGALGSGLAAASRRARLTVDETDQAQEAIVSVSASVVAPFVVGFLTWVLRAARERELTRLCFFSREGQLLLRVARRLAPVLGFEGDLRYFYTSRRALYVPGLFEINEGALDWILSDTDHLSAETVVHRVGLELDEVADELTAAGFSQERWCTSLSRRDRPMLADLVALPSFQSKALRRGAERRQDLVAYLEQEGMLGTACGVVDVGWHGRQQASLNAVIERAGSPPLIGFYFALKEKAKLYPGDRSTYLFDLRTGEGDENAIPRMIPMMEIFLRADHGLVVDYERRGEAVSPVLEDDGVGALVAWGLRKLHDTVDRVAEYVVERPEVFEPPSDLRAAIHSNLSSFWLDPIDTEVLGWGDLPFHSGEVAIGRLPIAQPITLLHVLKHLPRGEMPRPHHEAWIAASVARSSFPVRVALKPVFRAWVREKLRRRSL